MRGRFMSLRGPHAPHTRKEWAPSPTCLAPFQFCSLKKGPRSETRNLGIIPSLLLTSMSHLGPLKCTCPSSPTDWT